VLDSLRGLAQTSLAALQTRLELISNEVEEQGARIAQMAMYWALAGFCFALAVVLGAVLLVVLFWESNRVAALAGLAALFAAGGVAAAYAARSAQSARPRALETTIMELKQDIEALRAAAKEREA
jgi:uncharacterized membrane protein YqjE